MAMRTPLLDNQYATGKQVAGEMRYVPKLVQRRLPVNNAPDDKKRASYSWNA
jgi:hypothetical protein